MEAVVESTEQEKKNLIASMDWLIQLRWRVLLTFASISILFAGIFALLPEERLFALFAVLAVSAGCNLMFRYKLESLHEKEYPEIFRAATLQVVLDLCALTLFVHFSGGVENPLIIATTLPLLAACWLLPPKACNALAAFALALVASVALFEATGILGHAQLTFMEGTGLWQQGGYIALLLVSLAGLYFGSIHFTAALVGQLNEQRAYSIDLSQQLETKVNTIEATLERERNKRAKLEEALRLQQSDTSEQSDALTGKMKALESEVLTEINKLSALSTDFESNQNKLVATLEDDVADLRASLDKLQAVRHDSQTEAIASHTQRAVIEEAAAMVVEEIEIPSIAPIPSRSLPNIEDDTLDDEEDELEEKLLDETDEEELEEDAEDELEGDEEDELEEGEEDKNEEEKAEEDEYDEEEELTDPLSEALVAALQEIEESPDAESILMDVVLAEELPDFSGSTDQLQKLFGGLLQESIGAMPDGGRISITTVLDEDRIRVKISDSSEPINEQSIPPMIAEKKLAQQLKARFTAKVNVDDGVTYLLEFPITVSE